MSSRSRLRAFAFVLLLPAAAFAQGTLTPPGPPAPTMKSLDQVEARIPLSSITTPGDATALFIISQPGSYYLTGNLAGEAGKSGIWINASNVTVDLNGYALITAVGSASAVGCQSGLRQIAIRNGSIRGPWTFGLNYLFSSQVSAHDVSIHGVTQYGIYTTGSGALFENCQVAESGNGIVANTDHTVVRNCTITLINRAISGTVYGIAAAVVGDCAVNGVTNLASDGTAIGVFGRVVTNTRVTGVLSPTVWMISAGTAANCAVNNGTVTTTGSAFGITGREVSHCHVQQMQADSTLATIGIQAPLVDGCTVERITNTGTGACYGIRGAPTLTTTGSAVETVTVSRCTVSGSSHYGIYVLGLSLVENNRVGYCTVTGISLSTGAVRGNFTHNCSVGYGISNGLVTGNTSFSDTTAFSYGASVRAGPTVVGAGVGAFDANANFDL